LSKDLINNDWYSDSTSNRNQIDDHYLVVRVEGGLNWVTAAWNIAGQESSEGLTLSYMIDWWFICVGAVWIHNLEMYGAYLRVYSMHESSGSRVKSVVCQCLIIVMISFYWLRWMILRWMCCVKSDIWFNDLELFKIG